MNQFNAAAINLSSLIMPAASQLQPNIKTDSNNNFIELISNIISSELTAEKADTAGFINSNPAVKTALYQAVAALHLSNETAAAAKSSPELLESNPVIRQAVSINNLSAEEKQVFIKAVIFTSEIIASKVSEIKALSVSNETAVNKTFESHSGSTVVFRNSAVVLPPVSNADAVQVKSASALPAINSAGINVSKIQPESSAVINTLSVVTDSKPAIKSDNVHVNVSNTPAVIPAASIVSTSVQNSEKVAAAQVSSGQDVEFSKLEMLVKDLKEALKVFLDVRLGLFNETDKDAVNLKEEITAKTDTLNTQISKLKEIITDETKTAEISKLTAQIASGIAALFAAVDRAAYVLSDTSVTGVKPVSSNPVTGAGLNEVMASIRRIEVAISNNPDQGAKNAYAKDAENGLKEIIARIFVLLKDMNGKAEVIRTTEYVNAPNSSFTMRVTPDGKVIINTAESKYTAEQQVLPANTQAVPVKTAVAAAVQATVEEQAAAMAAASVKPASDGQAKNTQTGYMSQVQNAAVTPQALAPVVYTENDAYYNPETLAKNSAKELSQIFGAISDALSTVKTKESIQVPADAKVFERAADAAGRVKENIVIRQVVQNIQNAVETVRTTEVKMFLRPENLGSVSIRLESTENIITGKIQTASAEVRDILKAALPELRITLNNMGINADRLEITLMNNSGQNNFEGRAFGDSYKEWEGGTLKVTSEEIDRTDYAGLNGYLNFLA